jgi:hypothetical protein
MMERPSSSLREADRSGYPLSVLAHALSGTLPQRIASERGYAASGSFRSAFSNDKSHRGSAATTYHSEAGRPGS